MMTDRSRARSHEGIGRRHRALSLWRTTGALVTAVLITTLGASVPGCESMPGGGNGATANEYTGTLRGDVAAIGGETTGWVLKRKGEADLEVDVSRIRTQAESLSGLLVRIRGRIQQRNYVERGRVPVLIAERIDLAK